jgi:hypothetical protein
MMTRSTPSAALAEGVPHVILDGKVFASDRCSEPMTSVRGEQVDAWYSGKARVGDVIKSPRSALLHVASSS